ncbi:ABC transporter permease [Rubellicoccus peritrichatus]|uniref:ABC transporter permease subunit n=1 Tax=Rubellicoccus peritrichatus TaxID=3080537 RepID=A0AAQ3L8U5_9BACT|nr:ABC transporter permease subunit [Puniceicoccus sp. CR14]WOO40059.1 ABC transporter permease subunit [Puniceicoccus sp. CR14]
MIKRFKDCEYYKNRELMLMLAPCFLLIFVFLYIPMGGLIVAFKDFRLSLGILDSPWNGLETFKKLFGSSDFPNALRNTLMISGLRLTVGFVAPIVFAILLNEMRLKWLGRFVQTATYLPYLFSWVVLGGIFQMLLAESGPMNSVLASIGIDPVPFLTSNFWFIVTLIVTGIWQAAGYTAVIYLAALAGIDPGLYEAAKMDGAGRFRQIIHVTLPMLRPTIIVLFILQVGHILSAGFDQIYNMYNPSVYGVSDVIDTYVLRRLLTMDFSIATAAGLFKSIVGLVLVLIANKLARRWSDGESGLW